MFTPLFTPRGEHSLLFRRMEGRTENFTPRGKLHPQGTKFTPERHIRPWGVKFTPRGEVKNGPQNPGFFIMNFHEFYVGNPASLQWCCRPTGLPTIFHRDHRNHFQVPILPKVTKIGLQIFVFMYKYL
jgi:hypothetical protein